MHVHEMQDPTSLNNEVAEWMTALIEKTLKAKERFCLLLSGGNTPRNLYELLAQDPFKSRIDWTRLHVFFGDERVVPFSDDRNNGKMAFDALLSKVPIPQQQIHFINTSIDPIIAAEDYAKLLHQYFDGSNHTFDLSLLGLGDDGHTLSLFPGNEKINEDKNWVISLYLPLQQMHRITLTFDVTNRSACIAFLVTGTSKAPVLSKILNQPSGELLYPAQFILPTSGELHWFVDEAATHF